MSGSEWVGGLAGYSSGNITDASATGPVGGLADVGGLAGYNGGAITGASATGDVTGSGEGASSLGGLVGKNAASGTISTSQATGGTIGAPDGVDIGGLVGGNAGQIDTSFATEAVGADGTGGKLGGLVGYNAADATIANTYATGQVGAGTSVGGLVGDNAGSVQTSWASGPVASGASSGGVAGANTTGGVLTNVYWDVGTTGQAGAVGHVDQGSSTNVTGIGGTTGNDPDSAATYTGFDFTSTWTINPGASRPYLQNVSPQTPPQ